MEDKILLILGFIGCGLIIGLGVLVWFSQATFIIKLILSIFAIYSGVALAILGVHIERS